MPRRFGMICALFVGIATAGLGCARPIVCSLGVPQKDGAFARLEVRAEIDGDYRLEVMQVSGPGEGQGYCSAPHYDFGAEPTDLQLASGDYFLMAKAQRAGDPWAFPVSGKARIQAGRCYQPAMNCGVGPPDAAVCQLLLESVACRPRWFPRRTFVRGALNC